MEQATALPFFRCVTPVQQRFADIDMLGHVNNGVYFTYFDMAKADYFARVAGGTIDWSRPPVVIANLHTDFLAPTHWGEQMEVATATTAVGNKSLRLTQVLRPAGGGEPRCVCQSVMVYLDDQRGACRGEGGHYAAQ